MLQIISDIFILLVNYIGITISFILITLFNTLPTFWTPEEELITKLESDLAITIPKQYVLIDKNTEWFGFDEKSELKLKFNDTNFEELLRVIENSKFPIANMDDDLIRSNRIYDTPNCLWIKVSDGYEFYNYEIVKGKNGKNEVNNFEIFLNTKEKTLYYKNIYF